jgi:hypothetical protein
MRLVELTETNTESLGALVLVAGPKSLHEVQRYLLQCGGRSHRRCALYAQALDNWPAKGGHRYVIAFDDAKRDRSTLGYAINPWNCRKAICQVLLSASGSGLDQLGYCVILDDGVESQQVENWFAVMAQLIEQRGVDYAVEQGAAYAVEYGQ